MGNRSSGKIVTVGFALCALVTVHSTDVRAQSRVGSDSVSRTTYLGRAVVYGVATGLAFSLVDQWQNDPPEWGKSWGGYGKRAASNIGEFLIQEGVTEGIAAAMDRPLTYKRCDCKHTSSRIWWAVQGAVLDPMPNGKRAIAVPRIVGAYAGSLAQAAWRPESGQDKASVALVNGTTSLLLGAAINLVYEFRPHGHSHTLAGDRNK